MLKKRSRNPVENLVVQSKMKEYIASKGFRSSGDLAEAATELLKHHLDKAIARAKAHNKQTVSARDL